MKITIELSEDMKVSAIATEAPTLQQITNMCLTTILSAMNNIMEVTPTEQKEEMKTYLFDHFNESASTLLARFAPEIDMRPDITEEAILIKELEIANSKNDKLS